MSVDCFCDYDPPEFCEQRWVKAARVNHNCTECGRTIYRGEPYEYTAGLWDGYFNVFHVCAECRGLRQWALNAVPCFCWAYGSLLDDIVAMVDNYRTEVPGLFFEYGRQVVKAKRRREQLDMAAVLV